MEFVHTHCCVLARGWDSFTMAWRAVPGWFKFSIEAAFAGGYPAAGKTQQRENDGHRRRETQHIRGAVCERFRRADACRHHCGWRPVRLVRGFSQRPCDGGGTGQPDPHRPALSARMVVSPGCKCLRPLRARRQPDPGGPGLFSASTFTFICTPASRSQEVGLCLAAQAGEARLRDVVTQGGFRHFRRASQTPFNLIFEARP